jgi:hypothetical protein
MKGAWTLGWLAGLALLGGLAACGPAPAMLGDAEAFDPDWVIQVDLEMAPADWEELRNQARSFSSVFCNSEPPVSPFTEFEADVTIDGVRLERVGVRKKGFFGSVVPAKPSLKLGFNSFVRGQRFQGRRGLTLNNCNQDPSFVHQCLGYWLFDRAGVPAPRCNFALVRVNGEALGLYAHVESVQAELVARYFEDASGDLWEGALSDFQPDWAGTFQKKSNEESPDRSELDEMVLASAAPDDALLAALEPLVDLDRFYDYWVMEVLTAHWDGYASNHNNFYLYHDPRSGQLHFIPWGIDAILFDQAGTVRSVFADGILAHRLYLLPETRQVYLARLEDKLASVWDVAAIVAELDRMEALISPLAAFENPAIGVDIDGVRRFVRAVPETLRAELAAGPVVWDRPLGSPPCFELVGDLEVTFSTTWGSLGAPDILQSGTGTFRATVRGEEWVGTLVGSAAGMNPNPPPGQPAKPQLMVAAVFPGANGDRVAFVVFELGGPEYLAAGQSVPLDMVAGFGYMAEIDPATGAAIEPFIVMDGSLSFGSASSVDGAAVSGAVSSNLRESKW